MKKYTLIVVVLVLSIFNVVGALANQGGKRSCSDFGCSSGASCGGDKDNTATGCNISCQDGTIIVCPR